MDLVYYLRHISSCSPMLLVGGYVAEFCKTYRGNKFILREKKDLNKFIDDNSGRRFPFVLVIDLGIKCVPYVDSLLKFVEEYDGPLVVLSAVDINNLVFLSRFKLAIRKSVEKHEFLLPSHSYSLKNDLTVKKNNQEVFNEDLKLIDPILYKNIMTGFSNGLGFERSVSCLNIMFGKVGDSD